MDSTLKILLFAAVLFVTACSRDNRSERLGKQNTLPSDDREAYGKAILANGQPEGRAQLYRWDDQLFDLVEIKPEEQLQVLLDAYSSKSEPLQQPVEITWGQLMAIKYRLRYFEELGAEIYAPVFGNVQKELDGKEVIISGFVIPFDEDEEVISLSANPYASCFFCGKASPASVISMYMRNRGRRYKMDDFIKFRGTLHLNYDDPNEFYYILRDAREQ